VIVEDALGEEEEEEEAVSRFTSRFCWFHFLAKQNEMGKKESQNKKFTCVSWFFSFFYVF